MSAEPVEPIRSPWQPDPVRQRLADYTADDILHLPADAPRVELLDGVMLVVPSPTEQHQDIAGLLWHWLRMNAPKTYKAAQAVGVIVGPHDTYEPDVLLREAGGDTRRHLFPPDEVVLVVEVVSPGTRRRDRLVKPAEYAAAGIPFYWRIEQDPIHLHAYRLGRAPGPRSPRVYEPVADSATLIELDEPFPIKLPIADLTP